MVLNYPKCKPFKTKSISISNDHHVNSGGAHSSWDDMNANFGIEEVDLSQEGLRLAVYDHHTLGSDVLVGIAIIPVSYVKGAPSQQMTFHDIKIHSNSGGLVGSVNIDISLKPYVTPGLKYIEFYKGYFSKDVEQGSGEFTFKDGSSYITQFEDGRCVTCIPSPSTVLKPGEDLEALARQIETYMLQLKAAPAPSIFHIGHSLGYSGPKKNDKMHGKGVYRYENGDHYEGNFYNDLRFGHGVYTYHNGDKYTGAWDRDMKHGMGQLVLKTGETYHGQFQYNRRHGYGKAHYMDGASYEGAYRDDLRHGMGVMRYANGDIYDGSWVAGLRDGMGILHFANGTYLFFCIL